MTASSLLIFILLFSLPAIWWWMFMRKPKWTPRPFPPKWQTILKRKVDYYSWLKKEDQDRFEQCILQFFEDVTISGIQITLNDTDRLLVAASGVIPLFGFPGWRYRNLNEVLLYEGSFNQQYQTKGGEKRNILGMVGTGSMNRMMIISKPALHQGFDNEHSKNNVGIHEFVHLLDMADGAVDGLPENLLKRQYVLPWLHNMHEEIQDIKKRRSDFNPYGATNEAEFLSVASEYFFKRPELMERKHPEIYKILEKMFGQDPAYEKRTED